MRLPTRKVGKSYTVKAFSLDREERGIIRISELRPQREGGRILYKSNNNNCFSVNQEGKIKFYGSARRMLRETSSVIGYTFKLEDMLKGFGFSNTFYKGIWKKQQSLAA